MVFQCVHTKPHDRWWTRDRCDEELLTLLQLHAIDTPTRAESTGIYSTHTPTPQIVMLVYCAVVLQSGCPAMAPVVVDGILK